MWHLFCVSGFFLSSCSSCLLDLLKLFGKPTWDICAKGYVRATNPSVASMQSKHTLEEETPWRIFWCFQRIKRKWESRVTSYIGIDVAGLNAMMSILGNLPGPLRRDLKNIWRHHHQFMSMITKLATKHQWRTLTSLEERVMASPEPSRRPSTSEWTTLL